MPQTSRWKSKNVTRVLRSQSGVSVSRSRVSDWWNFAPQFPTFGSQIHGLTRALSSRPPSLWPTMRWVFRRVSAPKGASTRASGAQACVLWILPPSWVSAVSAMVLGLVRGGSQRGTWGRSSRGSSTKGTRSDARAGCGGQLTRRKRGPQHRNDTSDGLGRPSAQRDLPDYTGMSKPASVPLCTSRKTLTCDRAERNVVIVSILSAGLRSCRTQRGSQPRGSDLVSESTSAAFRREPQYRRGRTVVPVLPGCRRELDAFNANADKACGSYFMVSGSFAKFTVIAFAPKRKILQTFLRPIFLSWDLRSHSWGTGS